MGYIWKLHITIDVLEEMLAETAHQAVEKGIIRSRAIIVGVTHTKSSSKHETPTQILRRYTKELHKKAYYIVNRFGHVLDG